MEINNCLENENIHINIVRLLVKLVEVKDKYTAEHCERVMDLAVKFAKHLNISGEQLKILKYSAILHDIGKIGISKEILEKDGKLTDEEFRKIKEHPIIGIKAIEEFECLYKVLDVVKHHHEKVDGTGYPDGIKEMSVICKIVSLADSFDAMTSDRRYRKALPLDKVIQEIDANKGSQFDKKLAEDFIKFIKNNLEDTKNTGSFKRCEL